MAEDKFIGIEEDIKSKPSTGPCCKGYFTYSLIFAFFVLCLWMTLRPIPAADTWWMIKSGEVITMQKEIPPFDIFSFTAAGKTWINHEWLVAVIFWLLFKAGQMALLYVFKSLMVLLTYFSVFHLASKRAAPGFCAAAGIMMLLISGGNLYFDVRAYLFTYFFLSATLLILDSAYYQGKKNIIYMMLPITILWVNMHGGYILSYVLQILFLGSLLLEKIIVRYFKKEDLFYKLFGGNSIQCSPDEKDTTGPAPECGCVMIPASITLLLSLASGMINPYGPEIYLYPFSLFTDSYYKRHLVEWIRPDYFGTNLWLTVMLFVLPVLMIFSAKKLRLTDFLTVAAFSYLGFSVVRHSVLYSIAALPVLAVVMQTLLQKPGPEWFKKNIMSAYTDKILSVSVFLITIILSFYGFQNISVQRLSFERELFPVGGTAFLKANRISGPLYNPYEWGGYFILNLYPEHRVFIDGRANTIYPEEIYRESIESMAGESNWEEIMDRHKINIIFCNKYLRVHNNQRLADRLLGSPRWSLIFEDDNELLFIRKSPDNEKIIEDARQGRLNLPLTPFRLNRLAIEKMKINRTGEARELLNQGLRQNPFHLDLLVNLALLETGENNFRKAESLFFRALSLGRRIPRINFFFGRMYQKEGKPGKALLYYKRELKINPGWPPAVEALNELNKKRK